MIGANAYVLLFTALLPFNPTQTPWAERQRENSNIRVV